MGSFQYLPDGHHADDAGELGLLHPYVDFRDPAKGFPITGEKADRHAIQGCERSVEPWTAEAKEAENSRRRTPPLGP